MSKTLGLSMIVKDESHVIKRVLESVHKYIDYWVIVDTGSTDGTQQVVKEFFEEKSIPGELIEMEWVDFSTCRNVAREAIEKHTDYGFWIDADEEFFAEPGFNIKAILEKNFDCIAVKTKYNKVEYMRKNIWKCNHGFVWNGPIHEILASPNEKQGAILDSAYVLVKAEGSSWQDVRGKYLKHAEILSKHTEVDSDTRWLFYTAQSYRDAGEYAQSIEWYKKRAAKAEGFPEEIFISKLMVAKLSEIQGASVTDCLNLYNDAHSSDPVRGEAIKGIIQLLQRNNMWELSYVYSNYGMRYNMRNPYPHRILFLDQNLYSYEMAELHSISCFYTNRKEEGSAAYWLARAQLKEDMITPEQMTVMLQNEKHFPRLRPMSLSSRKPSQTNHQKKKKRHGTR
jgi:glycosyltransferase involved in cell wall biosynthesis